MATVQTIAKAKATGLILKNLFGIEPEYDYQENHVRLYYTGNNLNQVREKIDQIATTSTKPSDVRIDFIPMVAPAGIKKALPYALGAVAIGYILGKVL
jgi:hypothetical protein